MLLRLRQNTNAFWIHAVSLNMKVSRLPTYQLAQTVVSTLKNSKTLSNPPQLLHQWWQWTTKLVSFSQSKNWAKFAERTKSFSTRMQLKLLAKFLWMSTIWKLTSCPLVAIRCMVRKVSPILFWNYETFLLNILNLGVGALYVRRRPRVRLEPIQSGGGQERGLRSGTVPTPLVVGLGEACSIAKQEMDYDK